MSEALPALAALVQASREADPVRLLGRLLGAFPIHVLLTDCSPALLIEYASDRALEAAAPDLRPIAGRPAAEVFPQLAATGVLELFRDACASGRAREFRGFAYAGAAGRATWDGAIHPLRDQSGRTTHLLIAAVGAAEIERALTARERQVAELIADGLSNGAIARRLFVSRSTIATHVAHILEKLGFRSRAQVAAWLGESRAAG